MKYILILGLIIVGIVFLFRKLKRIKVGSFALITGGIKCGKSTLSLHLAIRELKKRQRKVKIKNIVLKLFKKQQEDIPQLYSNIPLAVKYIPITKELLTRKERFIYGSVIYLQEVSLIADSMTIRDKDLSERIQEFVKLIGHETKGGALIVDTQSVNDLHYGFRRNLSEYFYIHHLTKWIPFFLVAHVTENRYSDDGNIITTENTDTEEKLKKVLIPKSVWKKFDCYCYSAMTDNLKVVKETKKTKRLKAKEIISFK